MIKEKFSAARLAKLVLAGDRVSLSRAITLVESTLESDRLTAEKLLNLILPHTGNSIRIGVTGVPGVGKSTFIENFGAILTAGDHRVAILAIDPSSVQSKGSILGDKTRMERLSANSRAFIRPSPTAGSLGGVTNSTREAILLCEAAGYDVIIVETVGVGQSEVAVKGMTDFFLLLMLAGAGDELQGIKRGIMEMADLVAINKVEQNNRKEAMLAKTAYANALHLMPPNISGWQPEVVTCSALKKEGLEEIWMLIEKYKKVLGKSDFWHQQRQSQQLLWFKEILNTKLLLRFENNEKVKKQLKIVESRIEKGELVPSAAARELIDDFWQ